MVIYGSKYFVTLVLNPVLLENNYLHWVLYVVRQIMIEHDYNEPRLAAILLELRHSNATVALTVT